MALEAVFSNGSCRFMSDHGERNPYSWLRIIMRLLPDENSDSLFTEKTAHGLQWIFERSNEDEFLEYWGDKTLILSCSLRENLDEWTRDFRSCTEVEPEEVENLLSEILSDMVLIWHCRLGDKVFAEEFLSHREDPNYRKALSMFRSFMYRDLKDLPELPRGLALEWIRKYRRREEDTRAIPALMSLLVNHRWRKTLFSF